MKTGFAVLLGIGGAIVTMAPVFSQTPETYYSNDPQTYYFSEPQNQSALLTTQPMALGGATSTKRSVTLWDAEKLSKVANSIQANPTATNAQESVIPSNFIPKDLFHTPSRVLSENHPLEVFQPPAPNQSFGINLNRL